ncbi:uncharacterized protein LOC142229366 [Haematobia irritans]|uniref:uncharacterized protein LOC142229366 n=1 Tax=Haematobia irritans TaxID=7368 RepID=UPI003F4F45E8
MRLLTLTFIVELSMCCFVDALYIRSNDEIGNTKETTEKNSEENLNLIQEVTTVNSKYDQYIINSYDFEQLIRHYLHRLQAYSNLMKISPKYRLEENSKQTKNRHRRKIKMLSEIPSEQIDDLLKLFNDKYGIENQIIDETDGNDEEYEDLSSKLPSAVDPDYMYENLYEDEKDLALPVKSRLNSEYGSIQDLILQAGRNYLQREIDETKLHIQSSKHFI